MSSSSSATEDESLATAVRKCVASLGPGPRTTPGEIPKEFTEFFDGFCDSRAEDLAEIAAAIEETSPFDINFSDCKTIVCLRQAGFRQLVEVLDKARSSVSARALDLTSCSEEALANIAEIDDFVMLANVRVELTDITRVPPGDQEYLSADKIAKDIASYTDGQTVIRKAGQDDEFRDYFEDARKVLLDRLERCSAINEKTKYIHRRKLGAPL